MENIPTQNINEPSSAENKGLIGKIKRALGATALVSGAIVSQGVKADTEEVLAPTRDTATLTGLSKNTGSSVAEKKRPDYSVGSTEQSYGATTSKLFSTGNGDSSYKNDNYVKKPDYSTGYIESSYGANYIPQPELKLTEAQKQLGENVHRLSEDLNRKFAEPLKGRNFSNVKLVLDENVDTKETMKFSLIFTGSEQGGSNKTVIVEINKSVVANKYAMEEFFSGVIAKELE